MLQYTGRHEDLQTNLDGRFVQIPGTTQIWN